MALLLLGLLAGCPPPHEGKDSESACGQVWYLDQDQDGLGNPAQSTTACDAPSGYVADASDCDDSNADLGTAVSWFTDGDLDGFGGEQHDGDCEAPTDAVFVGGDCDDLKQEINPDAVEVCDGIDNDCDRQVDGADGSLSAPWYPDEDGDGYGQGGNPSNSCTPLNGYSSAAGDCEDQDPTIHPGADESDCNGKVDLNCDGSYGRNDMDGDGYDACEECNDSSPEQNPGLAESCDGLDNNCDGRVDEDGGGGSVYYDDRDGDGLGDPSSPHAPCGSAEGMVSNSEDCDDGDAKIGAALPWFQDLDHDSWGDSNSSIYACSQPTDQSEGHLLYVSLDGDCNDQDPAYHPNAPEDCQVNADYNCDGSTGFSDADGDGAAACEDCNDADASFGPDAPEICDGKDQDCDTLVDEDAGTTWYPDQDGDGYGGSGSSRQSCVQPAGFVASRDDCDDSDGSISPAAVELCSGAGVDEDCNGLVDAEDPNAVGIATYYLDNDGDGFGDAGDPGQAACTAPAGTVEDQQDCDDNDAAVSPSAAEYCDGIDNNCDGLTDDAAALDATYWYADADGDGWGDSASWSVACEQPPGTVEVEGDCDEGYANIHPSADEHCDAADVDEDCDGLSDDADPSVVDQLMSYVDSDGDKYGGASLQSCDLPTGAILVGGDCDDQDVNSNPAAPEICDPYNADEDCDGTADDNDPSVSGFGNWYADTDGDGYGNAMDVLQACDQPVGRVADDTDCEDYNAPSVHPGAAEICDVPEVDEDCDGLVNDADPGVIGQKSYYEDLDADGFGAGVAVVACDPPSSQWYESSSDCNDNSWEVNPGAQERCDPMNVDEDCDGFADDDDPSATGQTTWYEDKDLDGWGLNTSSRVACDDSGAESSVAGDCNDSDGAISPGAVEFCDSGGVDEDCDRLSNDSDPSVTGQSNWYADKDGDSYGDSSSLKTLCTAPAGSVARGGDCNDVAVSVNPGATEICDAANTDENCDGLADDASASGKSSFYKDGDGDGYGSTVSTQACDLPAGYSTLSTDCNDAASAINPAATETCDASNVDEDCDGLADDSDPSATLQSSWYLDADNDGYGSPSTVQNRCDQPAGYVSATNDCDDAAAAVNPTATEVCDDQIDNDCNGKALPACLPYGTLNLGDALAKWDGTNVSGHAGVAFSGAGDVNGDGISDFLVGSSDDSDGGSGAGAAWLIFGDTYFSAANSLGGEVKLTGEDPGDQAGKHLASVGDVNQDGFEDLAVGAPTADRVGSTGSGAVYLLYGPLSASKDLSNADGFLTGEKPSDGLGPVTFLGDTGGNNNNLIAVGAPGDDGVASNAGAVYILALGTAMPTVSASTYLTKIRGPRVNDGFGTVVTTADLNGDGTADLIVGAPSADTGTADVGATFVFAGPVSSGVLASSTATARYNGAASGEMSGVALGVGDIDNDGTPEILIGAYRNASSTGAVYIVPGSLSSGLVTRSSCKILTGNSATDYAGFAVSSPGDVNEDGYDEVFFGAYNDGTNGASSGTSYLFYGRSGGIGTQTVAGADASFLGELAGDRSGYAVGSPGDVTGDGVPDLLIGATYNDAGATDGGAAYLWSGSGL